MPRYMRFLVLCAACVLAAVSACADELPVPKLSGSTPLSAIVTDQRVDKETLSKLYLDDRDAALYAKLFRAQWRGDHKAFQDISREIGDKSLVDWAKVRRGGKLGLWLPRDRGQSTKVYRSPILRDDAARARAEDVARMVGVLLKADETGRALDATKHAARSGIIDRVEKAQLYGRIASVKLRSGQTGEALALAHLALQIGGEKVPQAGWVAGLASWMKNDPKRAAYYFAWVPRSAYAGPWMRSAAAFWTARSLTKAGQYKSVSAWLAEAAKNPHSFYGLIATRALGKRFEFNWSVPAFNQTHLETLRQYPSAVRALKLAQAGQHDMAGIELAMIDNQDAPLWREALAALAVTTLKPDELIKVADILQTPEGQPLDLALYPVAAWKPRDGYRLDPAILHAIARQESGFSPTAINKSSGATGLLQIMPRTARTLGTGDLKNPQTSLALGQKYIEDLLDMTGGDLFETAIAYNAGPGNLTAWRDRFAAVEDKLLFIELIPYSETRAYVERVMANYWIYSLRMGIGVASLDAVAAGKPALYASYAAPRDAAVYASVSSNSR